MPPIYQCGVKKNYLKYKLCKNLYDLPMQMFLINGNTFFETFLCLKNGKICQIVRQHACSKFIFKLSVIILIQIHK